jgi:hypothetical protein
MSFTAFFGRADFVNTRGVRDDLGESLRPTVVVAVKTKDESGL